MKRIYSNILTVALLVFGATSFISAQTFSYTGSLQTVTVPPCADSIIVQAYGAEGGPGPYNLPGLGAMIKGTFKANPGDVLNIIVGQEGIGAPISGPYYCGSGGGGSYVWNSTSSAKPMIIAGGGGGSSYGSPNGGPG